MISLICFKTLILLIWFRTDAFIIYSKLFRVNRFFHINEWVKFKETQDCSVEYLQYLRIIKPNGFWVKLVTCPICLCIWLCIPTSILFGLGYACVVCVSALFLYYLFGKIM